jgi:hypothetical protein
MMQNQWNERKRPQGVEEGCAHVVCEYSVTARRPSATVIVSQYDQVKRWVRVTRTTERFQFVHFPRARLPFTYRHISESCGDDQLARNSKVKIEQLDGDYELAEWSSGDKWNEIRLDGVLRVMRPTPWSGDLNTRAVQ